MFSHVIGFVAAGLVFALVYSAADKVISKIKDVKKRKYTRIAVYAILLFCGACMVDIIVRG